MSVAERLHGGLMRHTAVALMAMLSILGGCYGVTEDTVPPDGSTAGDDGGRDATHGSDIGGIGGECTADLNCTNPAWPWCDTTRQRCVGCALDIHCASGVCDTETNTCTGVGNDAGHPTDSGHPADSGHPTDAGNDAGHPQGDGGRDAAGQPDAAVPVDVDEPNGNLTWTEDKKIATPLALGSTHQGWISFVGDEDFYKVVVPAKSGLLSILLTTAAATPVDYRFQLTCPKRANYGEAVQPSGEAGPTRLEKSIALGGAITQYYLFVHDDGDDEADPLQPYSVTVTFQ